MDRQNEQVPTIRELWREVELHNAPIRPGFVSRKAAHEYIDEMEVGSGAKKVLHKKVEIW